MGAIQQFVEKLLIAQQPNEEHHYFSVCLGPVGSICVGRRSILVRAGSKILVTTFYGEQQCREVRHNLASLRFVHSAPDWVWHEQQSGNSSICHLDMEEFTQWVDFSHRGSLTQLWDT